MADDDKKEDSAADPWADILSGDSAESQPDLAFSFDDATDGLPAAELPNDAGDSLPPVVAADEPAVPAASNDASGAVKPDAAIEDDLVGAWLDEAEPIQEAVAQDAAAGSSAVEVGTGSSGIVAAEESDVWAAETSAVDAVSAAADADGQGDAFAFTASEAADSGAGDAEDESFPFTAAPADESSAFVPSEVLDDASGDTAVLAGTAAGAVVAGSAPGKAAKPAKRQKGAIGQMIGLVLGGAMAFPIVGGILIGLMWAGVPVPVGRSIGRALPESMAFLVPEKYQPGFKKGGVAAAPASFAGSPLDALGTGSGPAPDEPAIKDAAPVVDAVADLAVDAPQPPAVGEPLVDDAPVVPSAAETFEDPLAATNPPAAPAPLDAERAATEAKRLAAEAAAADRQPLDAAVEEALTALAAVEEVVDVDDPSRKTRLVDLYKALAKVAAELVILERVSGDVGRPLVEPPQSLVGIHGRLGRHREDLVRLGRNWLDYAKRPSDGVVLPVTFQASRRVGPYWSSRVTLAMPKGATRELTVLSRAEPAAVQGDAVMLTGMVFDGDVVWAADVRPLAAAGGGF
jgi:hypothetical protein